jgi:hypothetical protein
VELNRQICHSAQVFSGSCRLDGLVIGIADVRDTLL